jgi:hypothetical protein
MRTVEEILDDSALCWSQMTPEELRLEHEQLRRALETAKEQIALWSPLVAWRHRCPQCQSQRLSCVTCGDPW